MRWRDPLDRGKKEYAIIFAAQETVTREIDFSDYYDEALNNDILLNLHIGSHAQTTIYFNVKKTIPGTIRCCVTIAAGAKSRIYCICEQTISFCCDFMFVLQEEHAQVDFYGITDALCSDVQSITTKQMHEAPFTSSTVSIKSVVRDGGLCSYDGLIELSKKADNSSALQSHRALIVGKEAKIIRSKPGLKIENKNVSCTHESSISSIDPYQVWALEARGLHYDAAVIFLIEGFKKYV